MNCELADVARASTVDAEVVSARSGPTARRPAVIVIHQCDLICLRSRVLHCGKGEASSRERVEVLRNRRVCLGF